MPVLSRVTPYSFAEVCLFHAHHNHCLFYHKYSILLYMTILASMNLHFYMYGWEEASLESAVKPGEAAADLYSLLPFQW